MYSLLRNPVSYSVYAFVVLFVIIGFGESPLLVAQHILIPFTVDVTDGIGELPALIFRGVALVVQCLLGVFLYKVTHTQSNPGRLVYSVFGVLFVACYFLIVAFGYIMPRLH